jgi:glycosyltransferase involved in cell wall biosynthesis
MKILAFVNKDSAPAYHRIVMPLMMMTGADVFVTNDLRAEHFEERQPDIFMYNRVLPDHAMDEIRRLQKKIGFRICVDIDDYWELDPHHVLYQEYQDAGFAERQVRHLREADVILTTHERLADAIRSVTTSGVHVCPNAIPRQGQFDIETEPYDKVRLFWQGSVTHRADIELLRTPLESLGPMAKRLKMIMGGYQTNEAEWDAMARTFTAQLKHQYKLIPGTPVTSYYANYAQADICLVPLVNSPFNRMKSNLKILEAANMGLPVIASGVHPYLGMPVSFCKSSRDWIGHIKRLVQWPKRRAEEGQRLAEFCREHYDFHKINNERRQILEHVATKAGV